MRSTLDQMITEIRTAVDRGLPVTVEHVLKGLEFAIEEKREKGPVRFELGGDHAVELARQALVRQQIEDANRRFGQPHYGHGLEDIEYIYRGPMPGTAK